MKEKKKEMQRQVMTLLGILIFAFVNVFIFDDKMGAGFSAFSTITLMSIGLLSKRTSLRVLAIISYLINVVATIFGFNYVGFLTAVQAIELIFVIWYLYPRDSFLGRDTTDKYTYRFRWIHLLLTVLVSIGGYIVFAIVSSMWDGSFLEYGGNTALIFAMQYLLLISITKSRKDEPTKIAHYFQKERRTREMKAAIEAERLAKERALARAFEVPLKAPSQTAEKFGSNMIKFASVWLLVMDMSILAYFFRPNDVGFGFGAFFVLLTIVLSLIFKSEEDKEDVFSIIYHKIRPIQPIFFILLLIAHAHKFSYGAAYALLFSAAYFFWAINKINMKTLLTFTVVIYFFPVFGYLSNPYRLGAENLKMVGELVTDRNKSNTFYVGYYWSLLGMKDDGEYEGVPLSWQAAKFVNTEILSGNESKTSGFFYENNHGDYIYDLHLANNQGVIKVTTGSGKAKKEFQFMDFGRTYYKYEKLKKSDNQKRYKNFYEVGTVTTELGTYNLYLEMDQDWVDDYQKDPTNVDYLLLIFGDKLTPKEAYERAYHY